MGCGQTQSEFKKVKNHCNLKHAILFEGVSIFSRLGLKRGARQVTDKNLDLQNMWVLMLPSFYIFLLRALKTYQAIVARGGEPGLLADGEIAPL